MPEVPSRLKATRELATAAEFQQLIKAATYAATLKMGDQAGTTPQEVAAARARMSLVDRVVINQDPTWTTTLHWAMAATPAVVDAYLAAERNVSGLPDDVVMASLEAVWRQFAILVAQAAAAAAAPAPAPGQLDPVVPADPAPAEPTEPAEPTDPPAEEPTPT